MTLPITPLSVEREAIGDRDDFRNMSGDYVYRRHVASRGRLYVPHESSFLILGSTRTFSADEAKLGHFGGEQHCLLLERRKT